MIAEFSYRSTSKNDALVLANGVTVSKKNAQSAGIGDIFGRVLDELVAKMREMQMDQSEIGCLRAIVLFNPGDDEPTIDANRIFINFIIYFIQKKKL